MSVAAILTGVAFGAVHGARHAFEPDHLAAVTTMLTEAPGGRTGARLGAVWGIGHTLSLLALAGLVVVVGDELPPTAEACFQLAVAATLLLLGARSIMRGRTLASPASGVATRCWPLYLGMLHGLAGSGALTALAIAEMSTPEGQLAFVIVFGLGSIAGMAVMSGALGTPLARLVGRPRLAAGLGIAAGSVAVAVALLATLDAVDTLRGARP